MSKTEERFRTLVTIEGQLLGDFVPMIESCCRQAEETGKPVHLFLHDISTIDRAGRAMLHRLAAAGVRLLANGVYTDYVVRASK